MKSARVPVFRLAKFAAKAGPFCGRCLMITVILYTSFARTVLLQLVACMNWRPLQDLIPKHPGGDGRCSLVLLCMHTCVCVCCPLISDGSLHCARIPYALVAFAVATIRCKAAHGARRGKQVIPFLPCALKLRCLGFDSGSRPLTKSSQHLHKDSHTQPWSARLTRQRHPSLRKWAPRPAHRNTPGAPPTRSCYITQQDRSRLARRRRTSCRRSRHAARCSVPFSNCPDSSIIASCARVQHP